MLRFWRPNPPTNELTHSGSHFTPTHVIPQSEILVNELGRGKVRYVGSVHTCLTKVVHRLLLRQTTHCVTSHRIASHRIVASYF
ncbi:hypothetical protein HZ326_31515 [Fusarium oxysporum f. sp. albedinis]|nr:hypothetical protein HZ326_31515 [Fusarium oxysporum f. sp. albedinis]